MVDGFDAAERDATHEIAADWFMRLQEPGLSVEDTIAWQTWMSADERHARAFRRIEETWHRFQALPRPALIGSEALAADRYDGSMPVGGWLSRTRADSNPRHESFRPGRLALAASAAVVAIGVALALHVGEPWRGTEVSVIETGVGENRSVSLSDGSTVELGGRTRVEVAWDTQSRRLTLSRGEAYFTVAKDPARPFSVDAGPTTVTALGTQFNVRRADDRVVVAVVEGRVMVSPRVPLAQQLPLLRKTTPQKRRPLHLDAGSQSVLDGAGVESIARLANPSTTTAWQTGRLNFDREPLRYALESVNRYARKPIELEEEGLGNLNITGAALNDNIDGWIASIESAFGLEAVEKPARIVLRRAH